MFYTYLHRLNDTGAVFYVGKGRGTRAHTKSSRSKHWRAVVGAHGRTIEICASWPTEAEAFEHEVFLIDTMRALGEDLINKTTGGEGISGHRHSDETRAKMSRSKKAEWMDPEFRAATSAARKASWIDAARREAMSRRQREYWASANLRQQRHDSMQAASERPEVKARRSAAQQVAQNKPESIRKQQLARMRSATPGGKPAKPVTCLSTGDLFESVSDAARYFGLRPQKVSIVCRGERSHAEGLRFSFTPSA